MKHQLVVVNYAISSLLASWGKSLCETKKTGLQLCWHDFCARMSYL